MLVTNIVTFFLTITVLAIVPLMPAMISSRYLAYGLAKQKAELASRTEVATGRK